MLRAPFHHSLVLTGPTGSGKTGLALELAQRLDAEIVSMDSMALYRHMDIGTAKPTPQQRQLVPHHLIDVLDPWESASVAWWLNQAAACVQDIQNRGKKVLFVGGTPLYLKALMFGLFEGPAADANLRRQLTEKAARVGSAELHRSLLQIDPVAAQRIHPNDLRRIVRALEVFELTGKPISDWQQEWGESRESRVESREQETGEEPSLSRLSTLDSRLLWLDLPRAELYERINRRVEEMFSQGWVEEARALRELERPLSQEAAKALGYQEIFAFLEGGANLTETIFQVQMRSRQFAKRQVTWFRHLPGCRPVTSQLTLQLWQPKMET